MTVNDTDKFLVNRSGSSYQLEAQNLMAQLQDDDLMLVNRGGTSYKATGAEIKDSLGPKGTVDTPSIIAPADNAGETDPSAAPDADGLTIQSSAFASTPVGSLGHTSSDWQITLKTDTAYANVIDSATDDGTNLTTWEPTGLAEETAYRCRVRHNSGDTKSEWSADSTFKTADEGIVVGAPADWARNEAGDQFGNKKLINAFCGGDDKCWGGVAVDGTVAFAAVGSNITNWLTDPTGVGLAAAGLGYGDPYFLLRSDGTLLYKGSSGIPTNFFDFSQIATDIILAGNFGAVQRSIGYVTITGDLYVIASGDGTGIPASCGYTSLTANVPTKIPLVLPAGETVKRFLSCAGSGYKSHGWVVLSDSGKIYQFGHKTNGDESGGTASAPIDVTPVGEKIVSLSMASGAYETHHGCFAISQSRKLYGYMNADGANHGPLGTIAWANPFPLIDDSATYLEIASNYFWINNTNASYIMRHTVENGLEYAKRSGSNWINLPGSVSTNKKMFGAYQFNSGAILSYPNLLMPKAE